MRTHWIAGTLAVLFGMGIVGCGDDDGGQNNVNQLNNNNSVVTCGDELAAGAETCDGPDLRSNDCTTIGQSFTGGTLACNSFCDGWDTSACTGGASCGDDTVEGSELCDLSDLDGNDCTTIGQGFTGGTLACNSDCMSWDTALCTSAICGNDTVEGNELCDDTDLDSNDCTTIGQGFIGGTLACNTTCDDWVVTGCTSPTCGDGNIEGNELCDDTDLDNNDCTTIGQGFTGGTLACASTCDAWDTTNCTGSGPFCGDGNVDTGEDCDLTNLNSNDCTTIGQGFTGGSLACDTGCNFDTSGCTSVPLTCGNGTVDTGEDCDGGDLGSADCTTIGGGYTGGTLACSSGCTYNVSGCWGGTATCGNNAAEGGELCDGTDHNGETCVSLGAGFSGGTLGCNANCKLWDVSQCTVSAAVCGDGVIYGATEACDTNDLNGVTCLDAGYTGGTLACSATCSFDFSGCTSGIAGWTCNPTFYNAGDGCDCGCGIVDPDCNDATAASCAYCNDIGSCSAVDCTDPGSLIDTTDNSLCVTTTCGDNTAQGFEWCDGQDLRGFGCTDLNGNYVGGTLACAANCTFDESGCTQPVCGDNTAEGNEWCDGQDLQSAACVNLGYASGPLSCDANCNFVTTACVAAVCGDGTVEGFEQCDDGNTTAGDGCDPVCMLEMATETEPNNDHTTANGPFTATTSVSAAIGVAQDDDYFAVTVAAGATITAEVTDGGTGDCAGLAIDSELEIYDTDGTTSLSFNEDINMSNYCSLATYTAPAAGTYFVRAASSETYMPDDTFNYVLVITVN